jgi:hypothetical protein
MNTNVKIHFEIPDQSEYESILENLTTHPKDIWNYEERVKKEWIKLFFTENKYADEETKKKWFAQFLDKFYVHWTDDDILHTRVTQVRPNIIQYKVTLRAGVNDPRILVDLLRRCKCVEEGVVGGNWRIQAWYQGENEDGWTADTGNDDQSDYQMYTGLNEMILDHHLVKIQTLLYQLKKMTFK